MEREIVTRLIGVRCSQEDRQVGVLRTVDGEKFKLSPYECWSRYVPDSEKYTLPSLLGRIGERLPCPHCKGTLQIAAVETKFKARRRPTVDGVNVKEMTRDQARSLISAATPHNEMIRSESAPGERVDIVLGEIEIEV